MRLLPLLVVPVLLLAGCAPVGLGPVEIMSDGASSCSPAAAGASGDFVVALKNHGPVAVTLKNLEFTTTVDAKQGSTGVSTSTDGQASGDTEPIDGYVLKGNGEVNLQVHVTLTGASTSGFLGDPNVSYTDADHQSFAATAKQAVGFGVAPIEGDAPQCG